MDNETQLAATLHIGHSALTNASIATLLQLYPNDPYVGCPYNTGDALLPSGRVDKQSNAIYGDIAMHAGVRYSSSLAPACTDGIFSGARSRS
jgi:acetylcholinesterase